MKRLAWKPSGPAILVACLVLSGCSGGGSEKTGTVSGKVTLKNKPLTAGIVQLFNSQKGTGASATLDASGKFTTAAPVAVGEYQVAIQPPPAPPPMEMGRTAPATGATIPAKYQSPASSGFTFSVKEGPNEKDFAIP